jgi:hypothetical protein
MKLVYLLVLLIGMFSSETCYPIWVQHEHPLCYGHTRIMHICIDDMGNSRFASMCIGNPPTQDSYDQFYLPLIIGGD